MKIAFMDFFEKGSNAEEEITKRLKYCFEKQGDSFFIIDRKGIVISDSEYKDEHIDNTDIDLFFTFNHSEVLPILPNKKGIFFHWAPSGFLPPFLYELYVSNMYCFDDVVGGYETEDAFFDCVNAGIFNPLLTHIGSSVPQDYVLEPKKDIKRKLFYVGINLEAVTTHQRFGSLFRELDKKDLVNFYGPSTVFGYKNPWNGYRNYKGEIPFDGKSIMKSINDTGIVLALNSPVHSAVGSVSNRIYEAAAGGALIISDENSYVRKYFGNTVFYVDIDKDEQELSQDIENIINWANANPDKAYEMACNSQKRFLEHLTLDTMIVNFKKDLKKSKNVAKETIDVICFTENFDEYKRLLQLCENQTDVKIHPIIVYPKRLAEVMPKKLSGATFLQTEKKKRGEIFNDIRPLLKGDYFAIWDEYSYCQNRHLEKLLNKLRDSKHLFAYSGVCIKNKLCECLNDRKIEKQAFLSFFDKQINGCLDTERIFIPVSALFKRELLQKVSAFELKQISYAIHYYFAVLSILKNHKNGIFVPVITAQIKEDALPQIINDEMLKKYSRCHGTAYKELLGIFLKYKSELLPYLVHEVKIEAAQKISKKTKKILEMLVTHPHLYKKLKHIKNKLPSVNATQREWETFLRKRKSLRTFLYLLTKFNRRK